MNKSQRFKILKEHQWKEEEGRVSFHILDQYKTCYLEALRAYHRALFTVCIYSWQNNYCFEWVMMDEAERTFRWALDKYKKEKTYLKKTDKEFLGVSREISVLSVMVMAGISHFSNQALKKLLMDISRLGLESYGYSILPECADSITESEYQRILPRMNKKSIAEAVRVLSAPSELTFMEREHLDLLRVAVEVIGGGGSLYNLINKHTKDYFWIHTSFEGANFLSRKYFSNQLLKIIKEKPLAVIGREIRNLENKGKTVKTNIGRAIKRYKLSGHAKSFFGLIRYLAVLQDKRKENIVKLMFCIDEVLNEISRRFGVKRNDLGNYFVGEVLDLLDAGKKVPAERFKKRSKIVYFSYLEKGKMRTDKLFGKDAEEILRFFKEKRRNLSAAGAIQGFVASRGKGSKIVEGRVRVVFEPSRDVFKTGEVLVTGMTRPEFVPLIKRAKAIVTNEGGITTHAAIISRELKIPCIIGTKIATDVFKTGDWVRLNLETGEVIKINPH